MSLDTLITEAKKLSSNEQSELLDALLAMVDRASDELTPAQHADLLKRIAEDEANPDAAIPWEEVRKDMLREIRDASLRPDSSRKA